MADAVKDPSLLWGPLGSGTCHTLSSRARKLADADEHRRRARKHGASAYPRRMLRPSDGSRWLLSFGVAEI